MIESPSENKRKKCSAEKSECSLFAKYNLVPPIVISIFFYAISQEYVALLSLALFPVLFLIGSITESFFEKLLKKLASRKNLRK